MAKEAKAKAKAKPAAKQKQKTLSFGDFKFEHGKHYRVHFRNGHSSEFDGSALINGAPVNWAEVVSADALSVPPEEETEE